MGAKSCILIQKVLCNYYETVGISIINKVKDMYDLVEKNPDLVFVGVKNVAIPMTNNNLVPSDYLEENSIQYVGAQKQARNFSCNKELAKQAVAQAKLPTAKYFMAQPGQYSSMDSLPLDFPLFIKPPHLGSGIGIDEDSVVKNFDEYERKVESIFVKYGCHSLVEQYLIGREFTVAILEQANYEPHLVMPVEIITQANARGDRILDRTIKHEDHEQVVAIDEAEIRSMVSDLALKVFVALGGRDFGRIDIRLSKEGDPYFIEANLPPGLGHGYFARACKINQSISYESMIVQIAELGMQRNAHEYNVSELVTT